MPSWDFGAPVSGDRFWGQVRVFSGLLRESQGKDGRGARSGLDTGKTRREARLLQPADAPRNLHGKEGVNGSSPLEGFTKGQQMAFFVASAQDSMSLSLPPCVPKTCPQIGMTPATWLEHTRYMSSSTSSAGRGLTVESIRDSNPCRRRERAESTTSFAGIFVVLERRGQILVKEMSSARHPGVRAVAQPRFLGPDRLRRPTMR